MSSTDGIRVLVVDDHNAVRESIVRLIAGTPDFVVASQAANGNEALEKVRKETFDVVLLDITMPEKNGIEVLHEIKREKPLLPVVMLSIHPADAYKSKVMAHGAAAYVTKDRAAEELIEIIRTAVTVS